MKKELYYNPNKMLSFNRILNFVVGGRGIGKTRGMKVYCIKRFIKYGEECLFLRRYKDDLKNIDTFFNDVREEFPGHTLEVKNKKFFVDGKYMGFAYPLSMYQRLKSSAFPKVDTIVYDEFIKEKDNTRYLDNEPYALLSVMDSIFRNRDGTERVICLGNAISITNPLFVFFKIFPDMNKRFHATPSIVVELPESKEFSVERQKTRFGQLIKETEYGRMSLDNEFVGDSKVFIEKRTKESKFKFAIVYKGMTIGVWVDTRQMLMFLSNDYDPSTKNIYALTTDDMKDNIVLAKGWRTNYHLIKLTGAFTNAMLRFENQILRNVGYEMFNKMNIR